MTPLTSRREFLATTAGSTAALASGPLLAQADALPNRKVTVGIMGLNRGMQVADALENQPGVVIKYVCDVDSKRADEAKARLERSGRQRPQAIMDFRKILDDREVDALFCEAPNHWHGPATILACDAGKHVYVEKPCSHGVLAARVRTGLEADRLNASSWRIKLDANDLPDLAQSAAQMARIASSSPRPSGTEGLGLLA